MNLAHNNLRIRDAAADDAALLTKWWNDGSVMAHAGFPNGLGTTVEKTLAQIAACTDESFCMLVIELDGNPIGEMNYRNCSDDAAEIGIKICEATARQKGYGTRLITMLVSALFEIGYRKVVLDTNLKNTRAQHVYEKIGFRKLRINHDAWTDQLGEPQSSVDYEIYPEDLIGHEA